MWILNLEQIPTFKAYKNKCCVGEVVGINTAGLKVSCERLMGVHFNNSSVRTWLMITCSL